MKREEFDRIMSERGEKVSLEEVKSLGVYFAKLISDFDFDWLFKANYKHLDRINTIVSIASDNGNIYNDSRIDYLRDSEIFEIFHATPAQISLIESVEAGTFKLEGND